jgi:TRAP-type C4-dicarboxylate transport system permease small subunit
MMCNQDTSSQDSLWLKAGRTIRSIDRALGLLEVGFIVLLLGGAAVLNFSQVATRYLLQKSASSLEEISVFLVLWMVFLGMAHADRLGQNIALDIVHSYLSPANKKALWRFCDAILAVLALALAYYALDAVMFSYMLGETSVSKLSAPIWQVMAIIPVSFFLVGLHAMGRVITGREKLDIFDELDVQE